MDRLMAHRGWPCFDVTFFKIQNVTAQKRDRKKRHKMKKIKMAH